MKLELQSRNLAIEYTTPTESVEKNGSRKTTFHCPATFYQSCIQSPYTHKHTFSLFPQFLVISPFFQSSFFKHYIPLNRYTLLNIFLYHYFRFYVLINICNKLSLRKFYLISFLKLIVFRIFIQVYLIIYNRNNYKLVLHLHQPIIYSSINHLIIDHLLMHAFIHRYNVMCVFMQINFS